VCFVGIIPFYEAYDQYQKRINETILEIESDNNCENLKWRYAMDGNFNNPISKSAEKRGIEIGCEWFTSIEDNSIEEDVIENNPIE